MSNLLLNSETEHLISMWTCLISINFTWLKKKNLPISFSTISCAFIIFYPPFISLIIANKLILQSLPMVLLSQILEMLLLLHMPANFPFCKMPNHATYNFSIMSSSSTEVLYSVKVSWAKECKSYPTKEPCSLGVFLGLRLVYILIFHVRISTPTHNTDLAFHFLTGEFLFSTLNSGQATTNFPGCVDRVFLAFDKEDMILALCGSVTVAIY